MKIGILTYHSGFNYGACLQAFALQTTLKKLGYDSEIINFEPEKFVASREMFSRKPRRFKEIIKNITRIPYYSSLKRREKMFNDFTFDVLKSTPRFKTEEEIIIHASDYKCIICGSDQIWNLSKTHDAPAANPIFFLNFEKKQRRISYAASFASWIKEAPQHEDEFMPWLKQFDAVSVREQDAHEYLTSRGIENELTLDPTILLDKEDYDQICKDRLVKEKYICMFGWNTNDDLVKAAKDVSNKLRLPVYNIVPPPRKMFCGIPRKLDVGPCEFLSMIKHAEFVVTNSFHGTAFATIFEKSFVSIVTGKADTRMFSLLDQLGLSDHLVTKEKMNIDQLLKTDFSEVRTKKNELRKSSFEFLKKALKEV
ncbi:polysaccharide pyruvyl transferase family protein [Segatella baroniae]|uniref:polysaccharide pyruvyl transferase family protein n=1 Tax=Segatella baroniae TaxID=305719 RepID=UPI00040A9D60|nr:polysaccharide pyruvyl transferase family protein [Segatella baroniae]